jgi:hypothetical protein
MNPVQKRIFDQVVNPAIRGLAGLRVAEIMEIDHFRKKAKIAFTDGQRENGQEVAEVMLVRQQGFHEPGPFVGDTVLIGFMNNDYRNPIIIGSVDSAYQFRRRIERDRHLSQGSLLSDIYTERVGETWDV